ncbi:MAG: 4Fe-4S binding protein [Anaerolineae bacterium]|jgi:ferredoxin|nr:4Fe-4S binding protein [Anaerolineae bacterium]
MRIPLFPRTSTRAFIREARRTRGYSLVNWLHGYVYGRWTYLYIGIGTGEHPLSKAAKPVVGWVDGMLRRGGSAQAGDKAAHAPVSIEFADTYHGKVVTLETATQLVNVGRNVDLGDLEQIIPYALARDIVLQNPDHIVALDCPCRSSRPNPCLPLDVCLIVGEPFASFVSEHHPERTRWVSGGEATRILEEEHDRGHVHHAFFKDAMLGRFYAICNCCECCCGAMQAHFNGVPMLASSGFVCQADEELCAGCGACVDSCQFGAIDLYGGRSRVDWDACMGCGVCVDKCSQGALALARDEGKGVPLDMRALLEAAA